MDIRGYVFAFVTLLSCLCISYIAASEINELEYPGQGLDSKLSPAVKISYLEKMIKKDIEQELQDVLDLEAQINQNLKFLHTKKRQLEIKKREPMQCFLNIVSCWKRK